MSNLPVAGPHPEGRVFGTDWSIGNVATLLRSNAGRGMWQGAKTAGGYAAKINQNYLRTVSVRHLPTNVSLIFMRLQGGNCWYASLCFAGANDDYLPWNEEIAEQWLCALFGQDRARAVGNPSPAGDESKYQGARQFMLA
jgi:hypothetical protein